MAGERLPVEVAAPLVCVEHVSKSYEKRHWLHRKTAPVKALEDVNLSICSGTTMALVGESGSGKSMLARCLVRLEEPTSGQIRYEDKDLASLRGKELRAMRRRVQLIFQNPAAALNPRLTAAEIIAEPLVVQRCGSRGERRQRALELMEQVGLPRQWAHRLPSEFSGGQRQRLAIARALVLEPRLVILDEALSALDPSIQAQVANLLLELQTARRLTYLFITHDLSMAGHLADEVAIMHRGRIVEQGPVAELLRRPQHPYSRKLLGAAPVLETRAAETVSL